MALFLHVYLKVSRISIKVRKEVMTHKTTLLPSLILYSFLMIPINAYPNGSGRGEGGDGDCGDFGEKIAIVMIEAQKLGQDSISAINPYIKLVQLEEIRLKLTCKPEKHINGPMALSFYKQYLTKLDATAWNNLSEWKKFKLATHEFFILARYEFGGQYHASTVFLHELTKRSDYFKKKSFADEILEFGNAGTFTIVKPHFIINGEEFLLVTTGDALQNSFPWSTPEVISELGFFCKLIKSGSSRVLSFTYRENKHPGSFVRFSSNGGIVTSTGKDVGGYSTYIIDSISCSE